jgi:hypothetical protein
MLKKFIEKEWISIHLDPHDNQKGYYLLVESEALKSCFQPVRCVLCTEFMNTFVRTSFDNSVIGLCGCVGEKLHKHANCIANEILRNRTALCKYCNFPFVPENASNIGDGLIISNALDLIGYTIHGSFDFPTSIQDKQCNVNWYRKFSEKTPHSQMYDHDKGMPDELYTEYVNWITHIYGDNLTVNINYLIKNNHRKNAWILGFHTDTPETIDWIACLTSYDSSQFSWFLVHIQSFEDISIVWALQSVRIILERSTISMYCYKSDTGTILFWISFLFLYIFLRVLLFCILFFPYMRL